MSKEYDKVIKELLKDTVEALLEKITGVDIKKVELLDPKLQITDEREADFILKAELKDGSQEIYHIEFQVTNDNNMGYRELRYWVYLRQVYKLPVKQYVVYIGKKPLKMKSTLEED
ncbi:MAG: PD-(D/E)XK nuclease family transposase, partial [Candidatus Magnetoovum sp. WYHC-5]|nr:PD-(D/E)XK nuclease family transposase [Candidatus Magnetoovum sp. WYHC-5]